MLFTLEPLKAKEGDCILLHWGTASKPNLAVIDGGPSNIWETSLRPRLKEILLNRDLDQLIIDLVMVSHVDNDHIVGIKKLFRQLRREITDAIPENERPFTVKRLWHNTFNDILNDTINSYYETLSASVQASINGAPNPALEEQLRQAYRSRHGADDAESAEVAHDVALVLAGHGEARELRNSHEFLHRALEIASLNHPFKKDGHPTLITAERTSTPLKLKGLTITIVGPNEAEIQALQDDFNDYIQKNGLTADAVLAAYSDKSVPNLSSIVCLIERSGKRILLTGDARGDNIISGLKSIGLLDHNDKLNVDVLKVPHHGSDRNLAPEFFDTVIADTYIFSGNGKYGNPERKTLEWLTAARDPADAYSIVLTYPVSVIDITKQAEAVKNHLPWVAAEHSLAALFAERKLQGHQFSLVEGAPFKIELGDETVDW